MKAKKFDSVKMMHDIREEISKEWGYLSIKKKIALLKKEFPNIKRKTKIVNNDGANVKAVRQK